MSRLAMTIIVAGPSLVALGLLIPALRRARTAGDLDASMLLVLAMGVLVTVPPAAVAITGGVVRRPDAFGELVTSVPGWYPRAVDVSRLLLAAVAGALLFRRVSSGIVPVHAAGLLAICLWGVAQLASGLHGEPELSLDALALLVCLAAATVLPRGRGACLGAGLAGVALAIASGLLAAFRFEVGFVTPCEGACSGLGFTGVLPNENLLGIALVAAIPFSYLGFRGPARSAFVLYLAGMAIATGSRTASVAALVMTLALLIVRPSLDAGPRPIPWRAAISGAVLAVAVLASVAIVSGAWERSDLTDRPLLWHVASDYIERSPWFGYGPERWERLYLSSEIPRAAQRSTHNQWLDVLFVAGAVGAALFVAMIAAALWSARRARPGVALSLATVFLIGATEAGWSVGALDLLSFSLVALILTGPAGASAPAIAPRPQVTMSLARRSRFSTLA